MKRWVVFENSEFIAEECSIAGKTYYMIGGHVIPVNDLDRIGKYVKQSQIKYGEEYD